MRPRESPLHDDPLDVLARLGPPTVLLDRGGGVLLANAGWRALGDACACPVEPVRLFGLGVRDLLERARHGQEGSARLPLVGGSRRTHRLIARRDEATGLVCVVALDVEDDAASQRDLAERNSALTVLHDISHALMGSIRIDTLAERIHEQAGRIMSARSFYLALLDPETGTLSFPRYVDEGETRPVASRPMRNGMTEYLLRTREPLLLNGDVVAQAAALGIDPVGRPCHSWIGVPLVADGEALGALALQDYESAHRYGPREVEVLLVMASQAAAAVRNARLFEARDRALAELERAQARLLESERLRGVTETVGALHHEINNPLSSVTGNAQLLLRRRDLADDTRAKLEAMLEAARRIQSVTARMGTLIHATTMDYPGRDTILDLRASVSRLDAAPGPPPDAAPRAAA